MSQYGKFQHFCRDTGNSYSTLPVCNLFAESRTNSTAAPGGFGNACTLHGIQLSGENRYLANLGSILVAGLAIFTALTLLWRSDRKKAAVGRREMQFFLLGYIIIEICEIFTVGGFPLEGRVIKGFTAVHIAAIVATTWILMMNGAVGYQLLDDGTPLSLGLIFGSAAALFIGTGYIALDTGFRWTGYWNDSLFPVTATATQNQNYALYTLYQLVPLIFLVVYFLLETVLVLRVLGEVRPMLYLAGAGLLFAIGQVFQYVISVHICNGSNGKLNGGFFESLFTYLAVVLIWVFWSSITEDDWPMPATGGSTYT